LGVCCIKISEEVMFVGELSTLPNIGKVLEKTLNNIGVYTKEALAEMGSEDAIIRIRLIDEGACLHMLYALQGAIEGVRYTSLNESKKQDLKQFMQNLK